MTKYTGKALQFKTHRVQLFLVLMAIISFIFMSVNVAEASSAAARTANIELNSSLQEKQTISTRVKPVQLMVSIRPLALILNQLISKNSAEFWNLQVLVPPQSSVHDYQFKPSDLAKLRSVDMFVWLGPQMEPNISKGLSRFQIKNSALESSAVRWRELDYEGHDHHGHDSQLDPHIWLSLPQVPTMLKFMMDQLSLVLQDEPMLQGRGWSKQEIVKQRQQLQDSLHEALKVHREMTQKIKRLQSTWVNHRYITFHNGFGYLDDAFKVKSMGSFVNTPEEGIAPRQIQHLQSVIQSEEIGCLMLEPAADGRRVESLLGENLPIVDVDILGNVLPNGLDWRGFWEYIVEQMQVCFGSPSIDMPQERFDEIEFPRRPMQKQEQRILDKL